MYKAERKKEEVGRKMNKGREREWNKYKERDREERREKRKRV